MGYATYIGRVGALAVALGIGVAVANTPGVAWAEPSDPSSSGSSSNPESSDLADESPDEPAELRRRRLARRIGRQIRRLAMTDDSDDDDSGGEMRVSVSGGAHVSTGTERRTSGATDGDTGADEDGATNTVEGSVVADEPSVDSTPQPSSPPSVVPKKPALQPVSEPVGKPRQRGPDTARVGADVKKAQSPRGAASSVSETSQVQRSVDAVAASTAQRGAAVTAPTITPVSAAQAAPVEKQAIPVLISEPPTPPKMVPDVVSGVLTAVGLSPVPSDGPGAPVESPASVALFAGWRRLSEQGTTDETPIARSQPVLTGQTEDEHGLAFATMAALTSAPAVPTVGSPNLVTGTVSGSLNGYTVTGQPASGKVDVVGDTYTYTPTAAARLRAAVTTQPDYDSFPVAMTGQPATSVTSRCCRGCCRTRRCRARLC